jgi:hypothetical protein
MFYDCIEEAVDESFSEQEPNYFHEEPTKTEVNSCYTDVFVVNSKGLEATHGVDYGNDKDEKPVTEEDQNHEETKIQNEDTNEKLEQGPETVIVIPGSW